MKKVLICLLIFATLPAVAQYHGHSDHVQKSKMSTWMSITAPRHQTFWLFIDEVLQNERAVHSIRIENMWPDEFYIRIELDNSDQNSVGQFLDLRTSQSYCIEERRGFYGLVSMPSHVNADLVMNYRSGTIDKTHPTSPVPPSLNDEFMVPPMTTGLGMSTKDFDEVYALLQKESMENTRLSIAKQVIASNSMSTAQIVKVVKLFSFESNKLEFAKYAFGYCVDRQKYYLLNDAFDHDSSKRELNEYIQKKL